MNANNGIYRIVESIDTNAELGQVCWSPVKSIWYLSHLCLAVVGGAMMFSWSAILMCVTFAAVTFLGYSLGMHRKLIHNSYDCPKWMEYFFVYLAVLVGITGPFGMIYQHDLQDWAERKKKCHPYLRHDSKCWKDAWWQLNCVLTLSSPPEFYPEAKIKHDRFYNLLQKTWLLQQLPWALLLFYCGGIAWVIWGISVRITISLTGYWLMSYLAHNVGDRDWHIKDAAVQGYNIKFAGLITMGESWHNNHHAFPGSAMLGIYQGQFDPGWWVLSRLMSVGLVWNVKLPADMPRRSDLFALNHQDISQLSVKTPKSCPVLTAWMPK